MTAEKEVVGSFTFATVFVVVKYLTWLSTDLPPQPDLDPHLEQGRQQTHLFFLIRPFVADQ